MINYENSLKKIIIIKMYFETQLLWPALIFTYIEWVSSKNMVTFFIISFQCIKNFKFFDGLIGTSTVIVGIHKIILDSNNKNFDNIYLLESKFISYLLIPY